MSIMAVLSTLSTRDYRDRDYRDRYGTCSYEGQLHDHNHNTVESSPAAAQSVHPLTTLLALPILLTCRCPSLAEILSLCTSL